MTNEEGLQMALGGTPPGLERSDLGQGPRPRSEAPPSPSLSGSLVCLQESHSLLLNTLDHLAKLHYQLTGAAPPEIDRADLKPPEPCEGRLHDLASACWAMNANVERAALLVKALEQVV